MTSTPERIAPLSRADLDPESAATLRDAFPRAAGYLTERPDAPPLPPILGLLARHPALAGTWLAYNGALLDHGVLDARVRELLVLAVARHARSRYLWDEHVRLARAAGVSDDEISRLERGSRDGWTPLDVALLGAVDELVDDERVTDRTWRELTEHLDTQELLEMLFVVGSYVCLAMVVNSVGLTAIVGAP